MRALEACEVSQSHLLQMRGLKQGYIYPGTRLARSHLLQMRGLKRISASLV